MSIITYSGEQWERVILNIVETYREKTENGENVGWKRKQKNFDGIRIFGVSKTLPNSFGLFIHMIATRYSSFRFCFKQRAIRWLYGVDNRKKKLTKQRIHLSSYLLVGIHIQYLLFHQKVWNAYSWLLQMIRYDFKLKILKLVFRCSLFMQHMHTAWFHNWLKRFCTTAAILTEVKIDTILG